MNPTGMPMHQRGDISPDGRHYWDGDVWKWQSLWLVGGEVAEVVQEQFGRAVTSVRFLAAGMLNQSWHVETTHGSYVLRISRRERSRAQVAYEHEFLGQLMGHVEEVVAPLAGNDGETIQSFREHILSLFPFVDGVSGEAVDPDVRQLQSANMLARLHRASLDHIHLGQRPGIRSFDEEWRTVWQSVNPILRRDLVGKSGFDELIGTLDGEVASLERWLEDLHAWHRSLAGTTIHGDFNPRNVIFCDSRIAAVIDWDECRVDPIVWEVAQVGFGSPDVEPFAFWDVYLDAGGPLPRSDLDLMMNFARMGALLALQYTEKGGRATPHALDQLCDIATDLSRIDRIDVQP